MRYVCMYVCMQACTCTCMHARTYAGTHTCTHTCMPTHMPASTHACLHAHLHAHMHAYTHDGRLHSLIVQQKWLKVAILHQLQDQHWWTILHFTAHAWAQCRSEEEVRSNAAWWCEVGWGRTVWEWSTVNTYVCNKFSIHICMYIRMCVHTYDSAFSPYQASWQCWGGWIPSSVQSLYRIFPSLPSARYSMSLQPQATCPCNHKCPTRSKTMKAKCNNRYFLL